MDTLNKEFVEPLVVATKGGQRGGGAELTGTGKKVLAIYRRMQANTHRAIRADLAKLRALSKGR
jgi:molybdate transport system regulatory protein